MSNITVGNIRLAAGSDKNSIFSNGYHLITQISALYAHFTQNARSVEHKQVILDISDEIIGDIGDFYIVWEGLDKSVEQPFFDGSKLSLLLVHTCRQFARIIDCSNEWTPFGKMASLLVLAERRWRRVLVKMGEGAGKEAAVLSGLQTRCEERGQRIINEIQKNRIAERQTQNAFDAAEQSFLDKSFGF